MQYDIFKENSSILLHAEQHKIRLDKIKRPLFQPINLQIENTFNPMFRCLSAFCFSAIRKKITTLVEIEDTTYYHRVLR